MAIKRRVAACLGVGALLAGLAGCVPGRGDVEAAFVLPKGKRVLVFVDTLDSWGIPLDAKNTLATALTNHLYKYKAADNFVNPEAVTTLQINDPQGFDKLDVMGVAQKTGADVVLFVRLVTFQVEKLSSGMITRGQAEVHVRVTGSDGQRLWPPGETPPAVISAEVAERITEDQSPEAVQQQLISDLTVRIGRTFHKWSKDDKALSR